MADGHGLSDQGVSGAAAAAGRDCSRARCKASIKLWDVPTLGSRPHDPVATRDGAIWWTGQLANKLGRVDLKNGTIREYTLKTPHTGPHGLVEDKDGNIWFTGNHAALIGKLDPKPASSPNTRCRIRR